MKNKKVIFGIILFLLIGLTIFTFANPSENEKTFEDDERQEEKVDDRTDDKDKKDDEDSITDEDNESNQNNNINDDTNNRNVTNNTSTINRGSTSSVVSSSSNKYDEALKAVEKAESTLAQGDVDSAQDLVDDLEDNEETSDLNDRLEAVQKIIDATRLVATLEDKKNNAKTIDDIIDARKYNSDEKISDVVAALTNGDIKTDLLNRLNAVLKILNDTTPAIVSGIDKEFINKDEVVLTISDENSFNATLNGKEYNSGDKIVDEGSYELVVIDSAFNTVTKNFTIDRTKPEITIEANSNVVDDTVYYNSKVIPTIIENNIDTITLIKDGEEISYNMGEEIGEDGSYVLTVVDKATNTSSVEFVIDTTIPGLSNIYNGKIVEGGTIEASDTNFYYMTIKNLMTKEEKTVYEDTYTLPDIDADNTIYDIYVYDKAMNKSERVRIYHDNQDPVITGTGLIGEDNKTIKNNGTYKSVSLKISDGSLKSVVSVSGSDETILEEYSDNYTDQKIVYENTFAEDGTYTIKAIDRVGHESVITFTIDKTPIEVKEGSVTIFNRTNYENGNYKYAKNGDKLSILVTFTEEAYIPENLDESSFVLKINGDEVKFVRSQDTKYSDGSEKYEYIAQYTIPEDEAELTEGEITFEISGFTDLAGNTNAVINKADNEKYNSVIYDRTPALTNDDSNPLYILNVSDSSRRKYIKDGQTLRVEANFNEMLVENPILTIGDKQSSTFKYRGSKDGKYTYVADITIDNEKANLKNEEIIPFTITNIIDVAGNESTLNNDNVTVAGNYGQVIYDNSVGEVTFSSNGGSTVAKEFVVTVDVKEKYIDKIYYMFTTKRKKDDVIKKFNNNEGIEITNHDSGKFTVSKTNATNDYFLWVKVVDMAGNVSYTRTQNKFKLDNTYPDVKITTSNNGQPTKEEVTVTLKANEEIKELNGWTKVDDKTYTKVYSENYSGSIYVEDKIGNGVNVDYAVTGIDRVSPTMTVVDKNRYYIEAGSEYVDKGYSAIDDVEGDITSRVEKTYQFQKRGSNNWEVVPTIDTKNVGTYKITYTISDLAGNSAKDDRVVAIKDETAPVISINTLVKLKVGDKFIEDIYDNISDNSSDTLKVEIYPGTPILDTTTKGVYSINYKVSDGAGNYDVETRKIIVE